MTLLFFVLLFCVSIPFESIIQWLVHRFQEINAKLDKPHSLIYVSKTPFWAGLIYLSYFLKGFLPLYIGNKIWEYNFLIIPLVIFILWLNNWNCWKKFQNQKKFFLILWGVYTFLHPILGILYILGFGILSMAFNSGVIGLLTNCLVMFLAFWFLFEDPIYLMLNMGIFIIVLFAYLDDLITYIETGEPTIKTSFLNR